MSQRVWILGAGFSAGLGGPLLPDLLSMRSWQRLRAHWEELGPPYTHGFHAIYYLYHYGTGYPEGYCLGDQNIGPGERLFLDAEDFLVQLDRENAFVEHLIDRVKKAHFGTDTTAAFDALLKRDISTDATAVRAWASKLIAHECQFFLEDRDEGTWGPYERWAESLNDDDTIITFNYDRVIEELRPNLNIVGTQEKDDRRVPTLLKMHGSVDWFREGPKIVQKPRSTSEVKAPLLGLPGRSKTADTRGIFKEIWERAKHKLSLANEIYIVGYGLPHSDADSRYALLEGLSRNQNSGLSVKLILGEDNFRVRRIAQTFNQLLVAQRHDKVDVREQYAQDFLEPYALGLRRS